MFESERNNSTGPIKQRPSCPPLQKPTLRSKDIVHLGVITPRETVPHDELIGKMTDIFSNLEMKTHGTIMLRREGSRNLAIIEEIEDDYMTPNAPPNKASAVNMNNLHEEIKENRENHIHLTPLRIKW